MQAIRNYEIDCKKSIATTDLCALHSLEKKQCRSDVDLNNTYMNPIDIKQLYFTKLPNKLINVICTSN